MSEDTVTDGVPDGNSNSTPTTTTTNTTTTTTNTTNSDPNPIPIPIDWLRHKPLLQLAESNNPTLYNRANQLINTIRVQRYRMNIEAIEWGLFNMNMNMNGSNYCISIGNGIGNGNGNIPNQSESKSESLSKVKPVCIMKQFPLSYSKKNTVIIGY